MSAGYSQEEAAHQREGDDDDRRSQSRSGQKFQSQTKTVV